jgi:hypothetical protein
MHRSRAQGVVDTTVTTATNDSHASLDVVQRGYQFVALLEIGGGPSQQAVAATEAGNHAGCELEWLLQDLTRSHDDWTQRHDGGGGLVGWFAAGGAQYRFCGGVGSERRAECEKKSPSTCCRWQEGPGRVPAAREAARTSPLVSNMAHATKPTRLISTGSLQLELAANEQRRVGKLSSPASCTSPSVNGSNPS